MAEWYSNRGIRAYDHTLTSPLCGHAREEQMPPNACHFFYDCKECGARLKPQAGRSLCVLFLRLGSVSVDAAR